jgi:hypothetical protein
MIASSLRLMLLPLWAAARGRCKTKPPRFFLSLSIWEHQEKQKGHALGAKIQTDAAGACRCCCFPLTAIFFRRISTGTHCSCPIQAVCSMTTPSTKKKVRQEPRSPYSYVRFCLVNQFHPPFSARTARYSTGKGRKKKCPAVPSFAKRFSFSTFTRILKKKGDRPRATHGSCLRTQHLS